MFQPFRILSDVGGLVAVRVEQALHRQRLVEVREVGVHPHPGVVRVATRQDHGAVGAAERGRVVEVRELSTTGHEPLTQLRHHARDDGVGGSLVVGQEDEDVGTRRLHDRWAAHHDVVEVHREGLRGVVADLDAAHGRGPGVGHPAAHDLDAVTVEIPRSGRADRAAQLDAVPPGPQRDAGALLGGRDVGLQPQDPGGRHEHTHHRTVRARAQPQRAHVGRAQRRRVHVHAHADRAERGPQQLVGESRCGCGLRFRAGCRDAAGGRVDGQPGDTGPVRQGAAREVVGEVRRVGRHRDRVRRWALRARRVVEGVDRIDRVGVRRPGERDRCR